MALQVDKIAFEEFTRKYGEGNIKTLISIGAKLLKPHLKEEEDVYVILEPHQSKYSSELIADYQLPIVGEDGRKSAACIFIKG